MPRYVPHTLFCAALLGLAAGCQHHHAGSCHDTTVTPDLARAERGAFRNDLAAIVAATACPRPPAEPPSEYRTLTEAQAQCLASMHSAKANYLEDEARLLDNVRTWSVMGMLTHARKNVALQQQILHHFALEERNQNAALALGQYYRLAEYEAKAEMVRFGLAEVERAQKDVAALKARGAKVPAELEALEDQRTRLRLDLVRIEIALSLANDTLARLTGLECCGRAWRIRPVIDATPPPDAPELTAAQALAHDVRPSLRLNRVMEAQADRHTVPAMRAFMAASAGVSAGGGGSRGTGLCVSHREYAERRAEMARLIQETERGVADDVCLAVRNLRTAAELVCLTRQRVVAEQQKLRELEDKIARGLLSRAQSLTVRLLVYNLEAELFKEVADWHVARIQLRRAQGLLVAECPEGHGHGCAPAPAVPTFGAPVSAPAHQILHAAPAEGAHPQAGIPTITVVERAPYKPGP